jgi:hypothetical protein
VDLRDEVMDGELTSYHDLVPIYAALQILRGDFLGSLKDQEAADIGRKIGYIEGLYTQRKSKAFAELYTGVQF